MKILGATGRLCALVAGGLLLWFGLSAAFSQGRILVSLLLHDPIHAGYRPVTRAKVREISSSEKWIGSGATSQRIVLHKIEADGAVEKEYALIIGDIPVSDFWIVPDDGTSNALVRKVRHYVKTDLPIWTVTDGPFFSALRQLFGSLLILVLGAVGLSAAFSRGTFEAR